ncbi:MAG TPA: PilZ domain-containing protein [Bryobacteraceae bacterium]|nr:PilZ domain-containing protein [Bryobacteraceae bacterium]
MDVTTTERRRNRRYELRLPLHYQVAEKGGVPRTGTGSTCDLSSNGLSFRCRRPLPVGAHIEMGVEWPSKYGDLYPIELQITGFIVRSQGGKIGVRVTSRKFRVDTLVQQPYRATA